MGMVHPSSMHTISYCASWLASGGIFRSRRRLLKTNFSPANGGGSAPEVELMVVGNLEPPGRN